MIQGTGSDVGKSVIVAGLCRLARRRGLTVAPFKPQNMSNNAAVTPDGGEIGRAQALQAQAAGLPLSVDFNPVLLKPETDRRAQIVVHGRHRPAMDAADYMQQRQGLLDAVMESFDRLRAQFNLVIVEGAGSPAEINLRDRDIANMGFARRAGVPVCLLADIDRGGVIAALVGTQRVLDPADAAMIRAFVINKFRGDPRLFDDGLHYIEQATGWPSLGVIPWLSATASLPAEDAVSLERLTAGQPSDGRLRIAAPMLSRMANFDDADPLRLHPAVDFSFIPPGTPLPRDADVIIVFGSKSTIGDLHFLQTQGWHHDIHAHVRSGGRVLGLCGGYQMLGQSIDDPHGVDGPSSHTAGLGLLQVSTQMLPDKQVRRIRARCALGNEALEAYEIHAGHTEGPDTARPMILIDKTDGVPIADGARSSNGNVEGCYAHGLFSSADYRDAWLRRMGVGIDTPSAKGAAPRAQHYADTVEDALDALADGLERAIDVDTLFALAAPAL